MDKESTQPGPPQTVVYTGTTAPSLAQSGPARHLRLEHMPMLEKTPLDFDAKQIQILVRQPCTLVFYSQNSVDVVADSGVLDPIDLSEHTIWSVGQKTAARVDERFAHDVNVPEDERFEGLLDAFEAAPPPEPIVAFALEDSPRSLAERLRRLDNVHDVPVYRTCPVLYPGLDARLDALAPDWIAFTSPRGVHTFLSQITDFDPTCVGLAAIGPTTAEALAEHGLEPTLVPPRPDKELMVELIARQAH
jgi:uroporphyrinogen-III synthase